VLGVGAFGVQVCEGTGAWSVLGFCCFEIEEAVEAPSCSGCALDCWLYIPCFEFF
jgi:hypothetical protein